MHVLMKKFRCSSLLPRRQTSLGTPCCFLEYTVLLEKMRSEDEAELIESQNRETVAPLKERKDALGDLGHNQIVFEHCQAIVTHPAKTEILGNVIESLTRDRIVNVVEGTPCPAPWL
jgi:hypothetical protein